MYKRKILLCFIFAMIIVCKVHAKEAITYITSPDKLNVTIKVASIEVEESIKSYSDIVKWEMKVLKSMDRISDNKAKCIISHNRRVSDYDARISEKKKILAKIAEIKSKMIIE